MKKFLINWMSQSPKKFTSGGTSTGTPVEAKDLKTALANFVNELEIDDDGDLTINIRETKD